MSTSPTRNTVGNKETDKWRKEHDRLHREWRSGLNGVKLNERLIQQYQDDRAFWERSWYNMWMTRPLRGWTARLREQRPNEM